MLQRNRRRTRPPCLCRVELNDSTSDSSRHSQFHGKAIVKNALRSQDSVPQQCHLLPVYTQELSTVLCNHSSFARWSYVFISKSGTSLRCSNMCGNALIWTPSLPFYIYSRIQVDQNQPKPPKKSTRPLQFCFLPHIEVYLTTIH